MPSPHTEICICQVGHCDDACGVCVNLEPDELCPYQYDWSDNGGEEDS